MKKYLVIMFSLMMVTGCGASDESPEGTLTCTAKNKFEQYETTPTYVYTFKFNEGETEVESIKGEITFEYDENVNLEEKKLEIENQECAYYQNITDNCSATYENNKVILKVVMDPLKTTDNRKTMSKAEAKQRYESGNYDTLREKYNCK